MFMSFQAYIDNIEEKTGKTPEMIHKDATDQGILTDDMKATTFTNWLKSEYSLGHGHAMAMWKYFIDHNWIETKNSKLKK